MRHHSAVVGFFSVSRLIRLLIMHWNHFENKIPVWSFVHIGVTANDVHWTLMTSAKHFKNSIANWQCSMSKKKYRLHYDKCRWESWCCLEPQESEIEKRHHFSLTCMENLIPIKPTQNIQSTWLWMFCADLLPIQCRQCLIHDMVRSQARMFLSCTDLRCVYFGRRN